MIKVAICDDANTYIKNMELLIKKFGEKNSIEVHMKSYVNGADLMAAFHRKKYDVIFLDIVMPRMDGGKLAKEIRKIDHEINIVFCTSYYTISNTLGGYEVGARDFMKKPVCYKKIEDVLNKIYFKKLIKTEEKIYIKNQNGLKAVQISDIIYIEASKKRVIIHAINEDLVSQRKIYEFEYKFGNKFFYRCHNSYLVNFDFIEGVCGNSILLKRGTQKSIPISKYRREEMMKRLALYMGKCQG